MITRAEARKLYDNVSKDTKKQLAQVEFAIRAVAPTKMELILAISGYPEEFMKEQEKLYPSFDGLMLSTVAILVEDWGFDVSEFDNCLEHYWTIRW